MGKVRPMLYEFLTKHRAELIDRCQAKVARRRVPSSSAFVDTEYGVPTFIDQVIQTLQDDHKPRQRPGQGTAPIESTDGEAPTENPDAPLNDIEKTAMQHGGELLKHGFSVDQVVHGYGDLCQAVMELAFHVKVPISVEEFRTFNRCLDDAIAGAVTEYSALRDLQRSDQGQYALNERLGFLAHELRNLLHTATLAVAAMRSGKVGLSGATGLILDRSLIGLRNLIDRSLAEVRIGAGMTAPRQLVSVADFIGEIQISSGLEAASRGCKFTVAKVDRGLTVEADREMLISAVGNLLQNAFKFTHPGSEVSLIASATDERVLIAVKDHCGGLPAGAAETMFVPFTRGASDSSGLGLGLSIARRSVEANQGTLSVRDVPGSGCVFTIELPRHRTPKNSTL